MARSSRSHRFLAIVALMLLGAGILMLALVTTLMANARETVPLRGSHHRALVSARPVSPSTFVTLMPEASSGSMSE